MKNPIIYSSEKGNTYLYDISHKFSFLLHPDMKKIHDGKESVDSYYIEKYRYYNKYDFLEEKNPLDLDICFDISLLKENIRNIKQVVFETTDHCNLNCKYCSLGPVYNFGKKEHKNLDLNRAITLLKYVFENKVPKSILSISFFGGEPLVNIDLIKEIVRISKEMSKKKDIELSFNMTSNATLIDRHLDFLMKNKFHILISLDGDEKGHSYRVFRSNGENSFDNVIKNIDLIKEKYPKYFDEYISFNSVLNSRSSVKKIYDFVYNKYHKIPRIAEMNTDHIKDQSIIDEIYNSRSDSEKEFLDEDTEFSEIFHDKFLSYKEVERFLNNMNPNFYILNFIYLIYDQVKPVPTATCSPFQRKIFLNTNNDLLPCEKVSYKYVMGKVSDNVIIDEKELSERFNRYYHRFKEICKNCYARKTCSICFLTLENLDSIDNEDFHCPGFQDYDKYKAKLSRIFSFLEKYPRDFFKVMNESILN